MKKDNKGFSLVELIVVVAIMAVLMTVLAPQLLKYVEQTRLQKDNSAIAEMANVMKLAAADEATNTRIVEAGTTGLSFTLAADPATADKAGKKSPDYTDADTDKLIAEIKAAFPSFTTGSNTYAKLAKDITLTIKIDTDGAVRVYAAGMVTTPNATSADATQPVF